MQWDSAKTPCTKEDQTLIDPGVSDLAGAVLSGHIPPGWPKSPNCVYLGGYGLGPSRPATGVDASGIFVRTIAISNGKDTVLWQTLDMVGFFSRYRSDLCPEGCGMLDIRETIAKATRERGAGRQHRDQRVAHARRRRRLRTLGRHPRLVPAQIRDRALVSAYEALHDLKPAVLSIGAIDAPAFNSERRDSYYSAADYGAVWLQARKPSGSSHRDACQLRGAPDRCRR